MLPVKQFCGGPSGTKIIGKQWIKSTLLNTENTKSEKKYHTVKHFFQLKEKIGYNWRMRINGGSLNSLFVTITIFI